MPRQAVDQVHAEIDETQGVGLVDGAMAVTRTMAAVENFQRTFVEGLNSKERTVDAKMLIELQQIKIDGFGVGLDAEFESVAYAKAPRC